MKTPHAIRFLAFAASILVGAPLVFAVNFNESEPNDSKAAANPIQLLGPGDTITGNSTTGTGVGLDYHKVAAPVQPVAIYRNRLTLNQANTGTIRGLGQTPANTTNGAGPGMFDLAEPDATAQLSSVATGMFNQWYSFGRPSTIFYRVTGNAGTTADYAAAFSQATITPVNLGTFAAGPITLTNTGLSSTQNSEVFVYDANLRPIAGFTNDDFLDGTAVPPGGSSFNTRLTRDYAPGVYFVAISNFNTTDNQRSPSDEGNATVNYLDFPTAMANSSTATLASIPFSIQAASSMLNFTATKAGPYDVYWATFTVSGSSGGFVYVLNGNNTGNQLYGFSVDETTGGLTLLPGFPLATGGTGAQVGPSQRLALDSVNQRLYAMNHDSDTVSAYSINPATGALTSLPFSPILLGTGNWQVAVHPSGSPLVVGDSPSGFGVVKSYTITATTATEAAGSPFSAGSAGVRSSVFSRNGAFYYAGGGGFGDVAGFSVDPATGVLTALAGSPFDSGANSPVAYATDSRGRLFMASGFSGLRVFTTPAGVPSAVTGNPFASGISDVVHGVLHPNERFYFVVSGNANQFGSYQISGSGGGTSLTPVAGSPFASGASAPEALVLNHTGTFLFGANSNSRNLTTYRVDPNTGILSNPVVQATNTLGTAGQLIGIAYTHPASERTAVSRKTHGAAGTFDVNLPLAGTPGIECRTGAIPGDHQILVTFASPVTIGPASVTSGAGTVSSSNENGGVAIFSLSGLANLQTNALSFSADTGVSTSHLTIPINLLTGDANGNGSVNATDIGQAKAQSGQPVAGANFRADVNANGAINATDIGIVKANSGQSLP